MSFASFESRFLAILHKIIPFIEPTVKAVETGIASANQPGATKQSIAIAALTGANSVADADLSQEDQATADAVTAVVAAAINGTVADLKKQGTLAQAEGVTDDVIQAVAGVTAAIAPPAVSDATA
jgi:hypothetical protein